jgi:hypothetical protein
MSISDLNSSFGIAADPSNWPWPVHSGECVRQIEICGLATSSAVVSHFTSVFQTFDVTRFIFSSRREPVHAACHVPVIEREPVC